MSVIKTGHPPIWKSNVGIRELPHTGVKYYARAPSKNDSKGKNGIFQTVWLPVNASNRVVVDRQQDLMHLKYMSNQRKNCVKRENCGQVQQCRNLRLGWFFRLRILSLRFISWPQISNPNLFLKCEPCPGIRKFIKDKNGNLTSTFQNDKQMKNAYLQTLKQSKIPINFDLTRTKLPQIELELKPAEIPPHVKIAMWKTNSNSMAPFASLGKPTCGYYFTRNINHQKKLIGINPTNTVKWRSKVDINLIKNEHKQKQWKLLQK